MQSSAKVSSLSLSPSPALSLPSRVLLKMHTARLKIKRSTVYAFLMRDGMSRVLRKGRRDDGIAGRARYRRNFPGPSRSLDVTRIKVRPMKRSLKRPVGFIRFPSRPRRARTPGRPLYVLPAIRLSRSLFPSLFPVSFAFFSISLRCRSSLSFRTFAVVIPRTLAALVSFRRSLPHRN